MKRILCMGLMAAAACVDLTASQANAGSWCWWRKSSANAPPPPVWFRHEYPRYTAPVAGPVELVPGPGPANYANTPVPYYYVGGFAPGGFVPNYEYSGGNGGYRLDLLHPTPFDGSITVKPFWTFPGPIP